jgi:hypothetical protein
MADLDRELSDRLSRLADAVPVGAGRLDPVHRSAVATRQSVRLAWLTPLVVLVIGALVIGLTNVDPFAPGGSPGAGPITATVRSGDFELTLTAAKASFSTNEPLDVVASLVYRGPEQGVTISGQVSGPIGFEMWAPGVVLTSHLFRTCVELDMTRGVPLTQALVDLGNRGSRFSVPHGLHEITATAEWRLGTCAAASQTLSRSITVPVADGADDIPLRTDVAGEVTACLLMRNGGRLATSDTGLGVVSVDGKLHDVVWPKGYSARRTATGAVLIGRDSQVIAHEGDDVRFDAASDRDPLWPCGDVVSAASTAATSSTAAPTPAPAPSVAPANAPRPRAEEDDGTLGIRMLTPRASVHVGDPITVFTTYGYVGNEPSAVLHHVGPPVVFHLDQIDAAAPQAIDVNSDYAECTDSVLSAGPYADAALGPITRVTGDGVSGNWIGEHFDGSKLRLPLGRWRITGSIAGSTHGCEVADIGIAVSTWIEVTVAPVNAGGISLLTAMSPPASTDSCPVNTASGALAVHPVSGLGLEDANGIVTPVRWPFDVSAEQGPDGAVLYDSLGFRWAIEGQYLNLSGSIGADGIFAVCLPVAIALDAPRS